MMIIKIAATMFIACFPVFWIGSKLGSPFPNINNGADYVAMLALMGLFLAAGLGVIGGILWIWGIG